MTLPNIENRRTWVYTDARTGCTKRAAKTGNYKSAAIAAGSIVLFRLSSIPFLPEIERHVCGDTRVRGRKREQPCYARMRARETEEGMILKG